MKLFWASWSILPIVLFVTALNSSSRTRLRDFLKPDFRVILSEVSGNALGTGETLKIFKVRTRDTVLVEIYHTDGTQPALMERIVLDQTRDGHFSLHGRMTGLALYDLDGDSQLEILVPAFDDSLTAHLNVFKYDPISKSFFKVSSGDFGSLVSSAWPIPRLPSYRKISSVF